MKRLVFQTGGPWHPVDAQAAHLRGLLGSDWTVQTAPGALALDLLTEADLFVAAGMEWPGMDSEARPEAWSKAGIARCRYEAPTAAQRQAFRDYVSSGRPILVSHGGILCFSDWPEYGRLTGFRWHWGYTGHSLEGKWPVEVVSEDHPTVAGVADFEVFDELYFNVVVPPEMPLQVHAKAHLAEWVDFPMVVTAQGPAGRIAGAGKTAYLANGHSAEAWSSLPVQRFWLNTIQWLVSEDS